MHDIDLIRLESESESESFETVPFEAEQFEFAQSETPPGETGEVFGEMSLIDPGPRSATVTAACDTECLAASYQDFVSAIEENPERAVGFMKTLVRRLRKMNDLLERGSPDGHGFREMLLDCQPSAGSPEASALPWTMLW